MSGLRHLCLRRNRGRTALEKGQAPLYVCAEDLVELRPLSAPLEAPGSAARGKCFFEAEIIRIDRTPCGRARTEEVSLGPARTPQQPRPPRRVGLTGPVHGQDDNHEVVADLLEAVAEIVTDAVTEVIDGSGIDNVYRIGVDEVSHRKGHRYLTMVADHDLEGPGGLGRGGQECLDARGLPRRARSRAP
jgi:hypothetical protein